MARFYHPLTRKQDQSVRKEVVPMVVERSKANFESKVEDMPGLDPVSGREELAAFRETDDLYWIDLFTRYPKLAASKMQRWAMLARRYPMGGIDALP